MSTKTKFVATFANGDTITRTSAHAYGVAWRATWTNPDSGRKYAPTGFSVSKESASPVKPGLYWVHRGMSANERAEAKRKNAEFLTLSGYRVEFAPAVVA